MAGRCLNGLPVVLEGFTRLTLCSSMRHSFPTLIDHHALTHPNVRFWEQADFQKWCDTPAGQGHHSSHTNLVYLEDENGRTVSSRTIKAIRRVLRGGWSELVTRKIAPHSWGKLSASGRQLIHNFMENEFPLFKLANNGWKLDHLATTTYPAWRRNNLDTNCDWKSGGNIKKEDDNDDIDNKCAESDGEGITPTSKTHHVMSLLSPSPPTCSQISDACSQISVACSQISVACSRICVACSQISNACSPISVACSPISVACSPISIACSRICVACSRISAACSQSLTPALESPMSALKSPAPALESPMSALESPTPALGSPLPLIQSIATVDAITSLDAVSNADKNIPTESQTIPAPKPVKITIMNPLSHHLHLPPVVVNPVLGCAVQKATTSTAEPLSKPKKAKGKMRPSQTKNGRNLYQTNGTTDEFGVYYMGLAENQRTAYDKEAAELVATDKWDKTVGQGEMY
ncbi:hypothetical protein DFJ58DRAFT_846096 [Suillus subalutaceus]|uniref:uncharacterized protein n=1 Tax=Suillus subalutaceus TaxID=48586 RepID=UPI001B87AD44|nr:uncharacterized protein DFJ58DRAFT_846096 [Suillus subalutaceus]KAG1838384.1 hypothetical protein DFJ58DRAFT_846096 [Suillus subalutaceus]